MEENKYGKFLTVILVIGIISIFVLLGFLGYDWYSKMFLEKEANSFVDDYSQQGGNSTSGKDEEEPEEEEQQNWDWDLDIPEVEYNENTSTGSTSTALPQYKGYDMLGTMEIPATDFKYPILAEVTNRTLEVSVGFLYGAGINEVGNSVISGHNYRNGMFFSDNKKLQVGDVIYITGNDGTKVTYSITQKFETTPEDTSFFVRDTDGKREITLSTCTDDSSARTIIIAVEK